jgi:hypothetical protein
MAYTRSRRAPARKTSRRGYSRSGGGRKSVGRSRRTNVRRSGGNTLRIVIEQPGGNRLEGFEGLSKIETGKKKAKF